MIDGIPLWCFVGVVLLLSVLVWAVLPLKQRD